MLGIRLWSKQREIVASVIANERTAVRSGHSVGKTALTAALCLWWFCCRRLCVYTTAPGRDSIKDGLWKQIKKFIEGATRPLPGRWMDSCELKVDDDPGWWAKGFSTNSAERAQGKHEVGMLVVADEAAGVKEFIYDALESSMASDDVRMLIIGNPNYEKGYFYQAFHEMKRLWTCFHVSSTDSPNVTGKEPEIKGLATKQWVEAQRIRLKDDPQKFRMRVLGEWPTSDASEKVLPMDAIEAAQKLWLELEEEERDYAEPPKIHAAFVDVAGWGKDKSTLAYLRGQRMMIEFEEDDRTDRGLAKLARRINDWVCGLADNQKPAWIAVDSDAVGAGVHSRLCELRDENKAFWGRTNIVRFSWSQGARKPKEFDRAIAELHWSLRECLDPTRPREERIAIPPGNDVAAQLNTRKWFEDRFERKKVETKEQLRARSARSPDKGDAIVGCMLRPHITKIVAA